MSNKKEPFNVAQLRILQAIALDLQAPAIVKTDDYYDFNIIPCNGVTVTVDIYWSTAVIRIQGEWECESIEEENMIFLLHTARGSITDCVVKSGIHHVRTIARIKSQTLDNFGKLAEQHDLSQHDPIDNWSKQERAIFNLSGNGYFYLPFSWIPCKIDENSTNRSKNEKITIDCEYITQLTMAKTFCYLYIPLKFYYETIPFINDISQVRVQCMIHYPKSMVVQV